MHLRLGIAIVLLCSCAPQPAPPGGSAAEEGAGLAVPPSSTVETMLAEIKPPELRDTIDRLAGFGTRHTLSDTTSDTRGIGAARRWIKSRFQEFAAASGREGADAPRVYLDRHIQPADGRRIPVDTEIVNVAMELPGSREDSRGRHYYVIGHYDSRASDPMNSEIDAPGANDDGSGTALVIELARVMSRHRFDSTIVFMPTAGEEQGLYGAALHARASRESGRDIRAVLSNDIVGDPSAAGGGRIADRVRVFSEPFPANPDADTVAGLRRLAATSDSPSRQLARYIDQVASAYRLEVRPMLVFRVDRFLRGGDHTAFNREGYTGVRFSEVSEIYERQHQDVRVEDGVQYGDLPEHVDDGYLAGVARINAAALAHLANAPSAPPDARIVVATLTADTTLRWSTSPEGDVAGYEVVWRETTSPVWQHARDVGDVTEVTLALSKDNYFFGIRSYDRDGFRSPVSFPAAARE